MRVSLILVSADRGACDVFRREKESLIPRSLRDSERVKAFGFEFVTGVYETPTAGRSLQDFVLDAGKSSEAVCVLVDSTIAGVAKHVTTSCFVGTVDLNPRASSFKNQVIAALTRLIKNLAAVFGAMSQGASQRVLRLPLRNFRAAEIDALRELFSLRTLAPEFLTDLNTIVGKVNDRRRPRRNSTYPNLHMVDDDDKLFDYGKEHHATLETGGAHNSMCVLTGNFRFGCRLPVNLHYNVTREVGALTRISGSFPNCHDDFTVVAEKSHLNMFSNDYQT